MLTGEQLSSIRQNVSGKLYVTCYQMNGVYSVLVHEKSTYSMSDQFGIEIAAGVKLKREALMMQRQLTGQLRSEGIEISERYERLGL